MASASCHCHGLQVTPRAQDPRYSILAMQKGAAQRYVVLPLFSLHSQCDRL